MRSVGQGLEQAIAIGHVPGLAVFQPPETRPGVGGIAALTPERRDRLALTDNAELLAVKPGLRFAKKLLQGCDIQGGRPVSVSNESLDRELHDLFEAPSPGLSVCLPLVLWVSSPQVERNFMPARAVPLVSAEGACERVKTLARGRSFVCASVAQCQPR